MDNIEPGAKVIFNGLTMTLLEHDGTTAVCQWRFKGKLKADLFRLRDLKEKRPKGPPDYERR